ncbi:MAG: penicillin-binding protein [Labilithrix sp.]|nr:penicillin-binding protein [Labilithrix sp.]
MAVPIALTVAVLLARRGRADTPPSIAKLTAPQAAAAAVAPPPPSFAGVDLAKMEVKDSGATALLPDKRTVKLSVEPALQRTADNVMSMHHLPEAAVVVMEVDTGRVLVYASHVDKGPKRDLAIEATAPAASVFKVITGTSLVEHQQATPDQKECYSGGEQRLLAHDLVPDPKRDKWCTTVALAMGRSVNTVFARLALAHLKPAELDETAKAYGFNAALPFDVPVQPSTAKFPEDQLGYARTAAGFWNTTLSPLHAAWIGATLARGGEPVRPVLITDIVDDGKVKWSASTQPLPQKRIMKTETAQAVTRMMETTVSDGTSYRAFHDAKGRSFLPGVAVASKTGTLTDASTQRFYTWFAGFAPTKPVEMPEVDGATLAQPKKVAFGVLVVNDPTWTIKANVLAREVLRAYFAAQKVPGVSAPRGAAKDDQSRERDGEPSGGASTTPATKHRRQRGS